MRENNFEQNLRAALQDSSAADVGMQETSARVRSLVCQQSVVERIGFAAFLGTQVRFIGWKIWLMQALCLLFANAVLNFSFGVYYFANPRLMLQILSCLSVLVMLSALPVLYESARCRMHEVEAATRFSALRLLAAKLLLISAGDLMMLAGIWVYALWLAPLAPARAFLALLLPFLLALAGTLTMLERFAPARFYMASVLWCGLICIASVIYNRQMQAASVALLPEIVLALLLLLYCALTMHRMMHTCRFCELGLL